MSDPYIGEVRLFGCNFAPYGWFQCNGQLLPISQYTALFSILGTYYGGNGTSNFALPNLQGTLPIGWGQARSGTQYVLGEYFGVENVNLISTEMPAHTHAANASGVTATLTNPSGDLFAPYLDSSGAGGLAFVPPAAATPPALGQMAPQAIGFAGSSQPHANMQPYLAVTICIAYQGIFPSRG